MKKPFALICMTVLGACLVFGRAHTHAPTTASRDTTPKTLLEKTSFNGLKFRELGPALTSGRISDFAMHPTQSKVYYIATSSGGVWKTENAGTTFRPVFDREGSYSIGVVTLDPSNPNIIWVGTGENNNQRSVAYGDGVYKSLNGGKSWKHVGLKGSEHIGSIVIHPENPDIVYVAAIGPLWNEGGDRGLYKTTDGGETWDAILTVDAHTGVNEVHMDPRDPDVLYAVTFQRRRHVFTYHGGGPGSGIHKSTDGGETWTELKKGLPVEDKGRIGLAISPADPDIIYAIVEAAHEKSGFYRSADRGASWVKRSKFVTSGNYYQEIVADPLDPEKVYAMDTWMKVTTDGGKTFRNVGEDTKHVDNHCMWIDKEDTDHFIVGCDGGIYETWDAAKTWLFRANLPVIQFYKVSVDNGTPFYHIYGGTQDNFSLGGPARTTSGNGITNADWYITHGGDGFESQADPDHPDIVYAQSQYGVLVRYDKRSGEELGIQPQPGKDEPAYRWNWDAPLQVSNHVPGRIYFAANKVFRSDDRGSSWEVISEDLTRQIDRNTLEVMGRTWSIDAVAKHRSTSPYGTIVAFSESPLDPDLLFAGTDDGLVQITENGGKDWHKTAQISGVPDRTYVNALMASRHDENVVYACFNHHKYGDFAPYVYRSDNKGRSWKNISSNLPERGSAYAIAEDPVNPKLLFVGTEFGVFFTNDGGKVWKQLKSGVPTIAVRDIAIQERENDLVLGTFGRGFYVLDDYSALREATEDNLENEAILFGVRDALLFEYRYPLGLPGKSFQGDSYYTAENLGSEVLFTYYLKDAPVSRKEQRRKEEKKIREESEDVRVPDYTALKKEMDEDTPMLYFSITDASGNIVRKIRKKPGKGLQRIKWDLRYAPKNPIQLKKPSFYNPFSGKEEGILVEPGRYTVTMELKKDGQLRQMGEARSFEVIPLDQSVLPARDRTAVVAFQRRVTNLYRSVQGVQRMISGIENEMKHIREALTRAEVSEGKFLEDIYNIEDKVRAIRIRLNGDPVAARLDIDKPPSVSARIGWIVYEGKYSTSDPTQTHQNSLSIAEEEFRPVLNATRELVEIDMKSLRERLQQAGAPYTPNALPVLLDY